ncbi:MAG: methylated-DNA--[protein]-cysteine S-methyltransferase [Clostridia bacterium]|nr:methylated-DNA--[protein]-cysteine S-methyltransferase [Clostridia bacterium]
MKNILDDDLSYLIYSIVNEIPIGYVATYGQIARLINRPKNARLVGRALKFAFLYGDFPCHRVVNHQGRVSPRWNEQIDLLKSEGVTFKSDFCVDLKKHQWNI